jgi:small subunit ribosomal protein S9
LTEKTFCWGTGRRKTSVARVRITEGSGNIIVNGSALEKYFTILQDQQNVLAPLKATESAGKFDIYANVKGGGQTGQSGAMKLGVARALKDYDEGYEDVLREHGLLTRDPRMKERKKYGLAGARKRFQFSKR